VGPGREGFRAFAWLTLKLVGRKELKESNDLKDLGGQTQVKAPIVSKSISGAVTIRPDWQNCDCQRIEAAQAYPYQVREGTREGVQKMAARLSQHRQIAGQTLIARKSHAQNKEPRLLAGVLLLFKLPFSPTSISPRNWVNHLLEPPATMTAVRYLVALKPHNFRRHPASMYMTFIRI
jgi:hypothetical protein